jgi:hypothetical protein
MQTQAAFVLALTLGFGAALTLCGGTGAQNAKLDTPVSRQPTVGSEIERGQDAGFQCGLDHKETAKFVACVNDVLAANKQKTTLSAPFEFGLYVRALQFSYVHGVALSSDGMLQVWRNKLINIMKSTKLSFGDFCKAVGAGNCDTRKFDEQTYGSGAAVAPARIR